MKKNDAVKYEAGNTLISASVLTMHKDGSVTVKAMFPIDPATGEEAKFGFLGYKYRVDASVLTPLTT